MMAKPFYKKVHANYAETFNTSLAKKNNILLDNHTLHIIPLLTK